MTPSEDTGFKLRRLADDMAGDSIVTKALGRYLYQVIEFMFEEYVRPLRDENAALRKALGERK